VLRRLGANGSLAALDPFLKDWEYWCSEVLESHISYPAVAFFRSQHQRQSWVSALATVLDLSALITVGLENGLARSLLMPTPLWWRQRPSKDNWQTSPKGAAGAHL
jgi:hypothetical protein